MPPVPAIQGFTEDKLAACGVIAEVHPIVDFAPILSALCDGRSRFPRIDTTNDNIHAVQPAFEVQYLLVLLCYKLDTFG